MSAHDLKQTVNSLKQMMENNEQLSTKKLTAKLSACIEEHPHDHTLGAMYRVIGKMAENNTLYIKRAQLKELYTKLYSRNTKFAEFFNTELGTVDELKGATFAPKNDINPVEIKPQDDVLANALANVFDNTIPLKSYSSDLATKAVKRVNFTLDAWNLVPSSISIATGNDKFLIVKADYETPKGITSFYVPVEVNGDKVVETAIFLGNAGVEELNNTNIKSYLTTRAGQKLNVNSSTVLNLLVTATTEGRDVSGAELALIKLNATRNNKTEVFGGQILGQKLAQAPTPDVTLPKSDEFMSFEEKFTTPIGQAKWQFGENTVSTGMHGIVNQLNSLGYKNPKIVVSKIDDSTIYYGVSLDAGRMSFTVPVKVSSDKKIGKPAFILCKGNITPFDVDGLNSLKENNYNDTHVAAITSSLFGSKPSDLINDIRSALNDGNTEKAEDALNVLANSGDEKAYATGFRVYLGGLSVNKTAAQETKCAAMIKNSTSEHPICSHTGLPINKVYQDKDGNCRPLYRRGMDETYEGATFMNSKVFI